MQILIQVSLVELKFPKLLMYLPRRDPTSEGRCSGCRSMGMSVTFSSHGAMAAMGSICRRSRSISLRSLSNATPGDSLESLPTAGNTMLSRIILTWGRMVLSAWMEGGSVGEAGEALPGLRMP